MTLTQAQAEALLYILNKLVKHRSTPPFSNELIQFWTTDDVEPKEYYFLSEDYYQYQLLEQDNANAPLVLTVKSDKQELLANVGLANREINSIFN